MLKIQFSILGYYPTLLSDENITVGILFKNLETNEVLLTTTKNWQRLANFDDEADVDFIKKYLSGIKIEVENNIVSNNKLIDIEEYIKPYVNQFKFGKILYCDDDNFMEFVELTTKAYMKSNYSKDERLNSNEVMKLTKKIMKASGIVYKINPVLGKHGENIRYDFTVNNFGFKRLSFEGKECSQLVQSIKAWAFNSKEMTGEFETVFVCDDEISLPKYEILRNILYENIKYIVNEKDLYTFIQTTCVGQLEML